MTHTTSTYIDAVEIGASKSSIQEYAESISEWCGYDYSGNIDHIVKNLGGEIQYASNFTESVDASIFIDSADNFKILLPDYTPVTRDLFSVAHELGHYFLHYLSNKRPMQATRSGSTRVEWEANWFAAAFLMPERQFRDAFNEFDGEFILIADKFGVSVQAAKIRAKDVL